MKRRTNCEEAETPAENKELLEAAAAVEYEEFDAELESWEGSTPDATAASREMRLCFCVGEMLDVTIERGFEE